jgi:hypothetical protein
LSLDLESLRRVASAAPEARLVVLFGSVARGQAAPWSDADIGIAGLAFWPATSLGAAIAATLHREPYVVDLDRASDRSHSAWPTRDCYFGRTSRPTGLAFAPSPPSHFSTFIPSSFVAPKAPAGACSPVMAEILLKKALLARDELGDAIAHS